MAKYINHHSLVWCLPEREARVREGITTEVNCWLTGGEPGRPGALREPHHRHHHQPHGPCHAGHHPHYLHIILGSETHLPGIILIPQMLKMSGFMVMEYSWASITQRRDELTGTGAVTLTWKASTFVATKWRRTRSIRTFRHDLGTPDQIPVFMTKRFLLSHLTWLCLGWGNNASPVPCPLAGPGHYWVSSQTGTSF